MTAGAYQFNFEVMHQILHAKNDYGGMLSK